MIIYKPRGRAAEYSEYAANLYVGCAHACRYCYCPKILRMSPQEWAREPKPKEKVLERFEEDAKRIRGLKEQLLLCFTSDPYQSDKAAEITRKVLLICEKHGFKNVHVLTKAGLRAEQDFDILKRNGWGFGSTITFSDDAYRQYWEPNAADIQSRYAAVKKASLSGIFTWVSIEPVIVPNESLQVIKDLKAFVHLWKVGKLNHYYSMERKINWHTFYLEASKLLRECRVYWKKDLIKAAGKLREQELCWLTGLYKL